MKYSVIRSNEIKQYLRQDLTPVCCPTSKHYRGVDDEKTSPSDDEGKRAFPLSERERERERERENHRVCVRARVYGIICMVSVLVCVVLRVACCVCGYVCTTHRHRVVDNLRKRIRRQPYDSELVGRNIAHNSINERFLKLREHTLRCGFRDRRVAALHRRGSARGSEWRVCKKCPEF